MHPRVSFVFYFHPSRLGNLQQAIRLLWENEPELRDSEVVLVSQCHCGIHLPSPFPNTQRIDCDLEDYRKPVMCNRGVRAASGEVIALLDSDRILPEGYFARVASELRPNQAVTTLPLFQLLHEHSDDDMRAGRVRGRPDDRSPSNECGRKNLFSGNTVMWRADYLRVGGMDEAYIGYGFADNDMTRTVEAAGIEPVFRPEQELHLHHPAFVSIGGKLVPFSTWRIANAANGLLYHRKWRLPITGSVLRMVEDIAREIEAGADFPKLHVDRFHKYRGRAFL